MLVIKSLLESSQEIPTYWDGKAWGKGLEWAATYKSIDDLPAKLGSSILDSNSDPLCYRIQGKDSLEGAIAIIERITPKEDIPQDAPCYYIHVDLHIATTKDKIAILAQARRALASLTEGSNVLHSHIEVKPDTQAKIKPSTGKSSSITTTPLILEPEPSPLEQAIQSKLNQKK